MGGRKERNGWAVFTGMSGRKRLEWVGEKNGIGNDSLEHRDDIINFMEGRKTPSSYFNGNFNYWLGLTDDTPYCFILTSEYMDSSELSDIHRTHLSKTGKTFGMDFCIGNRDYLGKGLAAPTLQSFTQFFRNEIDPKIDRFFIDPDENNTKAIHVYEKSRISKSWCI